MPWSDPLRARRFIAAALGLAAGASLLGQTKPDQTQPARQPPIRVGVELVTTPVTVRDASGRFIADLAYGDFEAFEDGVKQTVVTFSLSHGRRIFNVKQPPSAPVLEGIILPQPRPPQDSSGRVFVLFVDDLHLEPASTPQIRSLFRMISDQLVHKGDMFAVISTGPSSIAIDLTYDLRRLRDAEARISSSGLSPTDILSVPVGAQGPPEVRHRVHVAFSTAYDLMQTLEKIHDRRKVLVYLSEGYDLNPFADTRAKRDAEEARSRQGQSGDSDVNPFSQQQAVFSDADLAAELSELTRAAVRANVTFYPIDPRGLSAGPDISQPIEQPEWHRYVSRTQDSLHVLADATGGKAITNRNDFEKAIQLIDAETSDYYMLGYYSSNPDPTKRRRRIEIRVKRPDVKVSHRTEYSLKPSR